MDYGDSLVHLLTYFVINILNLSEMESRLNDKTVYNTYADIIDWDILTEREYQIIRDLKDNGIEIAPTTIIKDLSGLPIGQEEYVGDGSAFTGKKHMLSDYLNKMPHGIIDKRIPGIGATTLEIKSRRNSIIVFPTKALAYSKHLKHHNTLYVGSSIEGKKGTSNAEIQHYINTKSYKKLLVVADSLKRVLTLIKEENYDKYFLMIDEVDVLQSDNNYRPQLEDVIDYYLKFPPKNRCMVTATMKAFSNPQLEHECKFNLPWICDVPREVKLLHTDNITMAVVEEILKHPNEKIFIAYNSIVHIREIILELEEETRKDCTILCSEASIKEAGSYYAPKLEKGEDGKEKLPSRINFATCCYFTGIDIEDKYHLISVSDIRHSHSILSIDRMTQIHGRCRISKGVLSETLVYSTFKSKEVKTIFDELKKRRKHENYSKYLIHKTEKVLNLIDSADKLSNNDSDLRELFKIVKEAIKDHTKQKSIGEAPIKLTRKNIDNQYVPAYLNIDYLQEKYFLYQHVYTSTENIKKEVEQDNCKVIDSISLSYIKTDNQIENEAKNKAVLKVWEEEDIQEAIAEIRQLNSINQLNESTLITQCRGYKKHKKTFYERVMKLYKYVDIDSLLYLLWEIRNMNNKAFKTINNAVVFWALVDNHPLKQSLNNAFQDKSKLYSSDELHMDVIAPIIKYHTHKTISKHKAVNLLNAFYEVKRTKNKGVNKYQIIGENPYHLKVHGDRIFYDNNNLLDFFIL